MTVRLGNCGNALEHVFRYFAAAVAQRASPVSGFAVTPRAGFQVEAGAGRYRCVAAIATSFRCLCGGDALIDLAPPSVISRSAFATVTRLISTPVKRTANRALLL